ncbi:hypothetical protein B0I33_11282 [Prauserella shujinwangii]|uniref:Polyketide cyclase/dehydrase/lipid transport protein n=1 Tax=Prauserella shujinwangii TaxID=1453103 RepID=A0A2T0LMA5_9PSEU|nr:SRPBCC family protein [Prauserella shujinwangii]PRX44204.1 hypothetical protein B0I33_11282 [Prauserella shujinwangii]
MRLSTDLAAAPEDVWRHVTSFAGINDELRPLLSMTVPPALRGRAALDAAAPAVPVRLGRSVLLLFGVLPVECDDIGLVEFEPPHRFLERSRMLTADVWEHERTVAPLPAGHCRVTDRVRFHARFPPAGLVLGWTVPRLFRHRHARLAARFGRSPAVS